MTTWDTIWVWVEAAFLFAIMLGMWLGLAFALATEER